MGNYKQFRTIIDAHPAGAPESEYIDDILRILFTPEEIAVAVHMSFKFKKTEDIAQQASVGISDAEKLLESMAGKAIIHSRTKDGSREYALLPTIPGLFEFPFMKGGGEPVHKKLGALWEKYHHESLGASFAGNPTPLTRVVPVEKSLTAGTKIHPYEDVRTFIENADFIALTNCACRVSVGKCDKPLDVCLIFDGMGRFLAERGYAREASKAEALDALNRSEEAGLVHSSNNTSGKAGLICNCCSCCCTLLRGRTELGHPHAFAPSRFEASVNEDECTGCGICADERCPVGAIELTEGIARVSAEKCIGCGLCISGCPASAIEFKDRAKNVETPKSNQELLLKVLSEKGKLDAFMKNTAG
jgi:Na+-translocating ferredoxin:NAD+ oxidoreductase subunit B